MSANVGGHWSRPIPLTITNDYNFNEKANYFLTNDRTALIMSVERDDSYGDRDLYVSFLKQDSIWSEPLNLGDIINTASEESAPFLSVDNTTLYFSSNGFSGYGGNDIYASRRLDDTWTNWSDPENLGPEINSSLEDLFFNVPANSDYAYYSRGVSENNTDIFRVRLPILRSTEPWVIVRGKIIDATTGRAMSAKIVYETLPDGQILGSEISDAATGEYEIRLPAGQLYGVRAEATGRISENQNLDLRNINNDKIITSRNFTLAPIQVSPIQEDLVLVLNNVFFDFDNATLKPESFPELNRIIGLMQDKTAMQIEIAGHADATGSQTYNLRLSERRAKAVVKYLTDKGISTSRIAVVFFGEEKPIAPNTTPDGRRKNRRVEFKILKI